MNTARIARTALAVVGAVGVSASIAACGGQVASADVGTCMNSSDFEADEITEIPEVDCSEEHDAQIFHKFDMDDGDFPGREDRKSTRLNSSHVAISYAVFCLKKKSTRCERAYVR